MNLSTVSLFKKIKTTEGMIEIKGDVLKKLQGVLLSMMDDFDKACRENDITYMLAGGSMLGAVRHNGFIPWDDDVDILMPRKDYDKLRAVFEKSLGEGYWLHSPEKTHNYGITVARVRKKGTVVRAREDIDAEECGAYIDIFVLENTFDNNLRRKIHALSSMGTGLFLSCRFFYKRRKAYLELINDMPEAKKVFNIKIAIGFIASFLSVDKWTHLTVRTYSSCKNNNSKYVVVPSGRNHFNGEMYERAKLGKVIEHEFEGRKYFIPEGYDHYLKKLYGDYMKIPEEKDREYHVVYELKLGEK